MPKNTRNACFRVGLWFHGEYLALPPDQRLNSTSYARRRLDEILKPRSYDQGSDLGDRWDSFRRSRQTQSETNLRTYLETSHKVLSVASLARTAVVCRGVLLGTSLDEAHNASFGVLRAHLNQLAAIPGLIPSSDRLDDPLKNAITPYSTTPIEGQYQTESIMKTMAGLAVSYLIEQQDQINQVLLPRPGVPIDQPAEAWIA